MEVTCQEILYQMFGSLMLPFSVNVAYQKACLIKCEINGALYLLTHRVKRGNPRIYIFYFPLAMGECI